MKANHADFGSVRFSVIARAVASALTVVALTAAMLPTPGEAAILSPAFAPVAVGASAAAFSGNVAACEGVRSADVAAVVATIRAARNAVVAPEPIESKNWKTNPAAFHAWLERNKPRGNPHMTIHQMTPVEFATFRAATLASDGRVSIAAAISACRVQALSAMKASPRNTCNSSKCVNDPCPKVQWKYNVANGTIDVLSDNSPCSGKSSTATYYQSNGTTIGSETTTLVTITGYPGAKSSIPGVQETTPTKYGNVVATLPGGNYVPQSGWVTLPGVTWKGGAVTGYISPSTSTFTVSLDASDVLTGYDTSYGGVASDGVELETDFGGTQTSESVVQASTQSDVVTCIGATIAFGAAFAALLTAPLGDPLAIPAAGVIGTEIGALGACSGAFDDLNNSAAGGAGGGGSPILQEF